MNKKALFTKKKLQQIIKTDDVKEILGYKKRRIGRKIIPDNNVRWKGYPASFDSWSPQTDLIVLK